MAFVEDYTENLALSVAQNEGIQLYFQEPTEMNRSIAMLSLNNLTSYEGVVRAVFLEANGVPLLDSLNNIQQEDYQLLGSEWYTDVEHTRFNRTLSPVYEVNIRNTIYYSMAYARNFYQNNRWCTIVVFIILNDTLYDTTVIGNNNFDCFYLYDADGNAFYTSGTEAQLDDAAAAAAALEGETGRNITQAGVVCSADSISSHWRVVSFVSTETILQAIFPYMLSLLAIMGSFMVMTLVVSSRSLGRMLQPIIALSKTMDGAAKGNLHQRVKVDRDDEIGLLETSYNKMIDDLQRSFHLIEEQEKQKQQAKFGLLVSQIDPHFIYNTINSINYLARRGRCEDIVTVNTALIAILRDRLRVNDIEITDTVANEKKIVDQYLVIEKFMYGGDLQLRWEIEEDLLQEQIPKNMIQPLVENSLFHGLINKETGEIFGKIVIRLVRTDAGIRLSVSDNGFGMDTERLQQVLQETYQPEDRGKKIGISNIRGRLVYLYGNADALEIRSAPNRGTSISITFPKPC